VKSEQEMRQNYAILYMITKGGYAKLLLNIKKKSIGNLYLFIFYLYVIDHSPLGLFRVNETTEMNLTG